MYTATRRPLLNRKGAVVGSEEWPLAPRAVTIHGDHVSFNDVTGSVRIDIENGGEFHSLSIDMQSLPNTVAPAGDITVEASLDDGELTVLVSFDTEQRHYVL